MQMHSAKSLLNYSSDVKAIELYCTVPENSTTQFCAGLEDIRPDIQIFGGISCSEDITSSDSIVFPKMRATPKNLLCLSCMAVNSFM